MNRTAPIMEGRSPIQGVVTAFIEKQPNLCQTIKSRQCQFTLAYSQSSALPPFIPYSFHKKRGVREFLRWIWMPSFMAFFVIAGIVGETKTISAGESIVIHDWQQVMFMEPGTIEAVSIFPFVFCKDKTQFASQLSSCEPNIYRLTLGDNGLSTWELIDGETVVLVANISVRIMPRPDIAGSVILIALAFGALVSLYRYSLHKSDLRPPTIG